MSGVSRPMTHIASAKMPERNGELNDEKKIAIDATVSTSIHASTSARRIADEIPEPWNSSISTIATPNSATSTDNTSAMPAYLPTTNSQRSIGFETIEWIVRRWTSV